MRYDVSIKKDSGGRKQCTNPDVVLHVIAVIEKREVGCKGCLNMELPFWGGECLVKSCCEKKGLHHCGECDIFPCEMEATMGEEMGFDPKTETGQLQKVGARCLISELHIWRKTACCISPMLESIRRDKALILHESEHGMLMLDQSSNVHMVSADNDEYGKYLVDEIRNPLSDRSLPGVSGRLC